MLKQIFTIIRSGHNEFMKVGHHQDSQEGRFHQCLLQSLLQNLRLEQRPTVENILNELSEERDIETESTTTSFDSEYWISKIGEIWKRSESKEELLSTNTEKKKSHIINTGRGYNEGRIIDKRVKDAVIARAWGTCCHCGCTYDDQIEDLQICHVKRHDSDGPNDLDNLMYGHKECDALYDAGKIIIDPEGGFYLGKLYTSHVPDNKQIRWIKPEYIYDRWIWELSQKRWAKSTEKTFRKDLLMKGYKYFP